jgi:replicative DNA helicase
MAESPLLTGSDAFNEWEPTVLSDTPPDATWKLGDGFEHVEIGQGRIMLVGGAPGAGKTALILQWCFNALALDPNLKVLICNVEMSPARLLDRQLARLSGVPLSWIRKRTVSAREDLKNIGIAKAQIQKLSERLSFVRGPYTIQRTSEAADAFMADLVVVDYAQRIGIEGKFTGAREKTNALTSHMREMADCGIGIIAAAALTRSKDGKGRSSYDGKHLSLASFRESSELEYACDDAFLLFPTDPAADPDLPDRAMTLAHVKSRDGETKTVELTFHRRFQQFVADPWLRTAATSDRFAAAVSTPPNGKAHR